MSCKHFTADAALKQLKDFQLRSVNYVFDRLYGPEATNRFLVADEVGLGKTLVARGVIARAIEHLQHTVDRLDIVYICSNAAIAAQNLRRLSIGEDNSFARPTRLTLLPLQMQELSANRINFVSMTPGTALELHGRGGIADERILIYQILRQEPGINHRGLEKMLQATVRNREAWLRWINRELSFDQELAQAYREAIRQDTHLWEKLLEYTEKFKRIRKHIPAVWSQERYQLIGTLRYLLAETCLTALQPDLVILDEFQRFKDLLDSENEAAKLARKLFEYPEVRILLLSATPYKMFTLDLEADDQHYADFIRTLKFLYNNDTAVSSLEEDIGNFRQALFALAEGDFSELEAGRQRLQAKLQRVMCRTERVGLTKKLDAMLVEHSLQAPLLPQDFGHAALVDRAGRIAAAGSTVEYWKSGPYLLNFLKDYELRRKLDKQTTSTPDLVAGIKKGQDHIITTERLEHYLALDPGNARFRLLFQKMLDNGLWRLLWLPPSLPYTKPAGAYAEVGPVTKALIFSGWHFVPDAIAALCSYEAERRMVTEFRQDISRSQLYDKIKPLLRLQKKDTRLSGMPVLAWLMPFPTLANTIDPLKLAMSSGRGEPVEVEQLLTAAEQHCQQLLQGLPPGGPGNRPDERWYWAAPAFLESRSRLCHWCADENNWSDREEGREDREHFKEHVKQLMSVMAGELDLGPRPKDLARVMAKLALAGPGTCALRALRRVALELPPDAAELLTAAIQVAQGFRTLFNLPETICLLRGEGDETYWRLTLRYILEGNLQAVLDEQVHILLDSLGLALQPPQEKVTHIAASLANTLSLRTAQISIDAISITDESIRFSPFNSRVRFALRFGELKSEIDGTLARAEVVRDAFNSPFRPFILASTSIGQEGLDFHPWCHAVVHWNLPANPVDLEQREGRVHRYKGHAIRKNIAQKFGLTALNEWDCKGDPWAFLFQKAVVNRPVGSSDLVPFWIFDIEEGAHIERWVPLLPFSREVQQLERLKRNLALYRLVFGQPRQEDLLAHLAERIPPERAESFTQAWSISLVPSA
ncbi:MAG: helicase [Deltaproteobacteria bacterium]|nr:helicase [Deltaproteobacteria bacterium]